MIFFLAWMVKNVFIAVITETFNEIRVQFQVNPRFVALGVGSKKPFSKKSKNLCEITQCAHPRVKRPSTSIP
jgi:hypothetical protein